MKMLLVERGILCDISSVSIAELKQERTDNESQLIRKRIEFNEEKYKSFIKMNLLSRIATGSGNLFIVMDQYDFDRLSKEQKQRLVEEYDPAFKIKKEIEDLKNQLFDVRYSLKTVCIIESQNETVYFKAFKTKEEAIEELKSYASKELIVIDTGEENAEALEYFNNVRKNGDGL